MKLNKYVMHIAQLQWQFPNEGPRRSKKITAAKLLVMRTLVCSL